MTNVPPDTIPLRVTAGTGPIVAPVTTLTVTPLTLTKITSDQFQAGKITSHTRALLTAQTNPAENGVYIPGVGSIILTGPVGGTEVFDGSGKFTLVMNAGTPLYVMLGIGEWTSFGGTKLTGDMSIILDFNPDQPTLVLNGPPGGLVQTRIGETALYRAGDMANSAQLVANMRIPIIEGPYAGKTYYLVTAPPYVLGTTALTFSLLPDGNDITGPTSIPVAGVAFDDSPPDLIPITKMDFSNALAGNNVLPGVQVDTHLGASPVPIP